MLTKTLLSTLEMNKNYKTGSGSGAKLSGSATLHWYRASNYWSPPVYHGVLSITRFKGRGVGAWLKIGIS